MSVSMQSSMQSPLKRVKRTAGGVSKIAVFEEGVLSAAAAAVATVSASPSSSRTTTPRATMFTPDTKVLKSKKKMSSEIGVLSTKLTAMERNTSRQQLANQDMQTELTQLKKDCDLEAHKLQRKKRKLAEEHEQLLTEGAALAAEEERLKSELQRVSSVPLRKMIDENL